MTATIVPSLPLLCPATFVVSRGWTETSSCVIDADSVRWDNRHVNLAEVTGAAYRTRRRSLNLVQRRTERVVVLETASDRCVIEMGTNRFGPSDARAQHDLYASLVATLHSQVEPRLRGDLLRSIAAGGSPMIGGLQLDRCGVTSASSGISIEWRQLPEAQLERGVVVVRATIEHPDRPVASIPMLSTNAVLLPELLAEATFAFS